MPSLPHNVDPTINSFGNPNTSQSDLALLNMNTINELGHSVPEDVFRDLNPEPINISLDLSKPGFPIKQGADYSVAE